MKKETRKDISELLKEYRKLNNYTVKEVVAILRDRSNYVAEKTMYGWENGNSQPDIETLFMLCEIYKINDVLSAFGYDGGEPFYITERESEIIKQYRRYEAFQTAIDKLLDL